MNMNNDFISLELAKWLKERGCEIPNTHWWVETHCRTDSPWEIMDTESLDYAGPDTKHISMREVATHFPAYSWYSILITHAKEFWGEKSVKWKECWGCNTGEVQRKHEPCRCLYVSPAQGLFEILHAGDFKRAEDYVREHSLFAD